MIAINITTFLLFGVDKGLAKTLRNLRIPEVVLHIYTLLGGIIGHIGGRLVFPAQDQPRKKTHI